MSESFPERLSRFTPDGTGLDRDALLFAAGRASARPNRRWLALCGTLAASQLLTVGLWSWPGSTVPSVPANRAFSVVVESPPPVVGEDSALWQLRQQALATEGNLPNGPVVDRPPASEPPAYAIGVFPESLFH